MIIHKRRLLPNFQESFDNRIVLLMNRLMFCRFLQCCRNSNRHYILNRSPFRNKRSYNR